MNKWIGMNHIISQWGGRLRGETDSGGDGLIGWVVGGVCEIMRGMKE